MSPAAVGANFWQQRPGGVLVDAGIQEEADPPRHAQVGQQAAALRGQLAELAVVPAGPASEPAGA